MLNHEIVIKVTGINTQEDSIKIIDNLNKIKGVISVKVNLKDKKVTLKHKARLNILELKQLINKLGYKYIGVE